MGGQGEMMSWLLLSVGAVLGSFGLGVVIGKRLKHLESKAGVRPWNSE
jgi:hypothetical protein